MEDLGFSAPFEENELFSFFFPDEDPNAQPNIPKPIGLEGKSETLFADPNSPNYSFAQMDDFQTNEQIPPLFPMLDQLKMEPIDDSPMDEGFSSPIELEPIQVKTKRAPRKKAAPKPKSEKAAKPAKRNPTNKKNSKRPTKKQKLEDEDEKVEKTSFIASLKGLSSAGTMIMKILWRMY